MAGMSGGSGGGGSAIRAGRAFVEMFLESNQMIRGLKALQAHFHGFGKSLLKIGGSVSGLGIAVLGPLAAIFKETAGHFDDVNDAATRLGTTAEIFTNLSHAAEMSGSSAEDLESSIGKMQKTLADAAGGSKEAEAAFQKLGLSSKDLIDLPLDQQMEAIADALAGVSNPTEKSALAMAIFGKSGRAMLPMLEDGAAGLREFADENRRLGGEIGGDQAKQGAREMDAYDRVMKVLKNTVRSVGAAFLPALEHIEAFTNWIIGVGGGVRRFITDNRQLVVTVAAVAGGLVVAGAAVAGLGGAFMLIGTAIGGGLAILAALKAVVFAVLSPVGLTVIAVAALAAGLAYLFSLTSAGQGFFPELLNGFLSLGDTIKSVMDGISDAFFVGDLELAGEIAMAGLKAAFADAMAWMTGRWNKFKDFFVDGWHSAVKLLSLAISGGIKFMELLFIDLGQFIRRNIGDSLTETLRKALVGFIAFWKLTNALGANDANIAAAEELYKGLSNTPEQTQAARDKAEKDRLDRDKKIEDLAKEEQRLRDEARKKDAAGADEEAAKLRKQLEDLKARAKALKEQKLEDEWQQSLFDASKIAGGATAAARIATETRGGFGGANARQMYAFGDKGGVAEKQLAVQEDIRDGVGDLKASVDELDGVAFA